MYIWNIGLSMQIELKKLYELSIGITSFYSYACDDSEVTVYMNLLNTYAGLSKYREYKIKMEAVHKQFMSMSIFKGARDHFFEPHDPLPENGVCYLNLRHWPDLRLYCIRYNDNLVIVGGGDVIIHGEGASEVKLSLSREEKMMKQIAEVLKEKINETEISVILNQMGGMDFVGDLKFEI